MEKKDLRIVYMGTPEFAVEPLKQLVENNYTIVGVITAPDKPVGRHGSVLQSTPVKQYALEKNIPILQPERLKEEAFLKELQELKADLQIVVAFRMLPEVVWNMPPLGTFNLHASLLPQYRGAAPINWAIINGEKETGLTTFFLTHEIDTGAVIKQVKVPILETDDAEKVHDKLMIEGGRLVLNTVDAILENDVKAIPQTQMIQPETLFPAPKIFRETCQINWDQPVEAVYNFIRGLSPYPAAWTQIYPANDFSFMMKIYETNKIKESHSYSIGDIVSDGKTFFRVAVKDGFIDIKSLQMAGKKRLNVEDFLRGYKIDKTLMAK